MRTSGQLAYAVTLVLKTYHETQVIRGPPKNTSPQSYLVGTGALSPFTSLVSATSGLPLHRSSVLIK